MKFSVSRTQFLNAVALAGDVINPKTPIPDYKKVKLVGHAGQLWVSGTDMEAIVHCEVPHPVIDTDGQCLLPADRLKAILQQSQTETVEVDIQDEKADITVGDANFRMDAAPSDAWSEILTGEVVSSVVVMPDVFEQLVNSSVPYVSTEEGKFAMRGVSIQLQGDVLTFVATDSKRLGWFEVGGVQSAPFQVIVPAKALRLAKRLAKHSNGVAVTVYNKSVFFVTDQGTVGTVLMEGRFPPYRDVIPKNPKYTLTLKVGAFLQAIRQAQVMVDKEMNALRIDVKNSIMVLDCSSQNGESVVKMPVDFPHPMKVRFDPDFLVEFLSTLDKESTVDWKIVDLEGTKSHVFDAQNGTRHLIVPLS